jgi:3-oxoacyl-[acyl-carrier protein] reductase
MRMTPRILTRCFGVNLRGAFNCIKLAFRPMSKKRAQNRQYIQRRRHSRKRGTGKLCASKAGLIGLTKSAAKEFAKTRNNGQRYCSRLY